MDELAQAVWQLVGQIPEGQVATYGQLAKLAGYPSHARFVGRTLANLPKKTKLPWHRVLNASLRVSYRAGGGDSVQIRRLKQEGIELINGRVPRSRLWQP